MATVTLIVSGGIAAYKTLELTRLLRKSGHQVVPILTENAQQFITPLSMEVIAEHPVFEALFAPDQESKIGHIQLARNSDVVVVAPATANILAKMALGLADDLATTLLLANIAPVLVAPAMNHRMWENPATVAHIATLRDRGVSFAEPNKGDMACGEYGVGRMAEPMEIYAAIEAVLCGNEQPLKGKKIVVTGGPTYEPIDPVRFIGNRSSGKQSIAIVSALAQLGADITFVHGPISVPNTPNVRNIAVTTAQEMYDAVLEQKNMDVFIAAAAVADWRTEYSAQKIKKSSDQPTQFNFIENPDILAKVAKASQRPKLVVGFAAETEDSLSNAAAKLRRKKCDWLMLNEVSAQNPAFGETENHLIKLSLLGETIIQSDWGMGDKQQLAGRLASEITEFLLGN